MQYTRNNDRGLGESLPAGRPTGLEGTWFNCDPMTGEIRKMVFVSRRASIILRAFGADQSELNDWGETPAKVYVERIGSSVVTGLTADYDFGFMTTRLAGNIKYGVLVIQSYNEFSDESGRPPYFTREFFSQEVTHRHESLPAASSCAAGGDLLEAERTASEVGMAHLTGRWTNTNPDTSGITHFDLVARNGGYFLRATGAGRAEPWPEVEAFPHSYDVRGGLAVAFRAEVDFGFTGITLGVNENKGLLIVASLHRFTDESGRASYFKREFFYRTEAVLR